MLSKDTYDQVDQNWNKDVWTEICGDGMDFGKNEWEDGNIINGDGWSSTWEMEKWYEWKGGTINTKDVWSLLYIKATLSKGAISNTYDINFSSEMKQISVSLNDLLVTVSSKYSILYTWSANFINEKVLRISIETNYVLIGDETVSIKFINYKEFRGPYGGWLVNTEIISNASGNLKKSEETASSFSVFAKYSAYFGIIVTIILIIFGGGSFETFWALLNSMQIISYLPLMTPYFPQHVRIMFQVLKFSNLNFDFFIWYFYGFTSIWFWYCFELQWFIYKKWNINSFIFRKLSINIVLTFKLY